MNAPHVDMDDPHDGGAPLEADLDSTGSGSAPVPGQAAQWADTVWGDRPGWAALAYGGDPYRDASGKYKHRSFTPQFYRWPDQRNALLADVARELATGPVDIYVAPHLRSSKDRKKHTALPPLFLHADIDGQVAVPELWEQLDPIRVQSGTPGHEHGYIALTRTLELPAWDRLQWALRDRLGGDTDSKIADNDVLRLPGTLNFKPTAPSNGSKPGEPSPVILLPGGGRAWEPDELAELLGVDLSTPNTVGNGHQGDLGPLAAVPVPAVLPRAVTAVLERHRDNIDRSAVWQAVIGACCGSALSRDETFAVVCALVPGGVEKYDGRLDTEFDRSWRKALDYWDGHAGGVTYEEAEAIRCTYADDPAMIESLLGDITAPAVNATPRAAAPAATNGAEVTSEQVTGGNDCGHDNPDIQTALDTLLAARPDLCNAFDKKIYDPDYVGVERDKWLRAYRDAAGPQASAAGACAFLRRHQATLDFDDWYPPCAVAGAAFPVRGAADSGGWGPVDLTAILDGTAKAEEPTLLARTDGHCLLYRSKVHWIQGEPESGKSWVAQYETARVLINGGTVIYIDHESAPDAIVGRLLALGVSRDDISRGLRYIQPQVGALKAPTAFSALLTSTADLIVIDGVTDALGTNGSSVLNNDEVAAWMRLVPRALAKGTGAAVVCVDHVVKSANGGRFAIGAQAKLAGVDGAVYLVEPIEVPKRGMRGELALRIGKDRPGAVRPECGPYREKDRTQEAARLILDSTDEGRRVTVTVQAPEGTPDGEPTTWGMKRRTAIMEAVSTTLEEFPEGLTQRQTRDHVKCRKEYVAEALKVLKAEKYVGSTPNPHASHYPRWISIRPYRQKNDPLLISGENGPADTDGGA
jgi:AAA domain-containing protein